MRLKWALLGVFGVSLIINPYLACSSEKQPDFTYTEADMKQALLGTWQGSAEVAGEIVPFSLVLEQASSKSRTQTLGPPQAQPACASRSFVKPAAACVSVTTMPLVGTITSENPALNGNVDGSFTAYHDLDRAELALHLDGGASLFGTLRQDALSDGSLSDPNGSFSLSRP